MKSWILLFEKSMSRECGCSLFFNFQNRKSLKISSPGLVLYVISVLLKSRILSKWRVGVTDLCRSHVSKWRVCRSEGYSRNDLQNKGTQNKPLPHIHMYSETFSINDFDRFFRRQDDFYQKSWNFLEILSHFKGKDMTFSVTVTS